YRRPRAGFPRSAAARWQTARSRSTSCATGCRRRRQRPPSPAGEPADPATAPLIEQRLGRRNQLLQRLRRRRLGRAHGRQMTWNSPANERSRLQRPRTPGAPYHTVAGTAGGASRQIFAATSWSRANDLRRVAALVAKADLRSARLVLQIDAPEFLHALSGIHLRGEDVALAIHRDVVQRRELADLPARPAEAAERC